MTSLNDFLKEHQFDAVQMEDDRQVKTVLIALGLENHFDQNPTELPNEPVIQHLEYTDHPTHFIVFTLFLRFKDRKDNGYRALLIPKSKIDPVEWKKLVRGIVIGSSSDPSKIKASKVVYDASKN